MAFKKFIEHNLGAFFRFLIYAMLEWIMIIVLFIDGFLSFFSNEFAKLFELRIPCLLCTRIDHVLVHRDKNFYYNNSICDVHKKDISSLAYCHLHKKLFDTTKMCETCLLSFATERDSSSDVHYKSLMGILKKDISDCDNVEDDQKVHTNSRYRDGIINKCSCCGEPLNAKAPSKYSSSNSISGGDNNNNNLKPKPPAKQSKSHTVTGSYLPAPAPAPSPRVAWKNEEGRNLELPPINLSEMKYVSDSETKISGDANGLAGSKLGNEGLKAITTLFPDFEVFDNGRANNLSKGNKFFGIPLSDSAQNSPRKKSRRAALDKLEFLQEIDDQTSGDEASGDSSIVHMLRKQVCLDRKSLIEVYMELDEERNASAIAANNAMAMITRLQADKAAVQMEALQYQRLMEEQAEYDQEAIQFMKEELLKKDEEIRDMESELEVFREKYGELKKLGSEICEIDDEDYQQFNRSRFSSASSYCEKSDIESPDQVFPNQENENSFDATHQNASALDFKGERSHLLSRLVDIEKKLRSPPTEEESISSNPKEHEATAVLTREVSMIREGLRSIEAASDFLKHAAMTLQKGSEGADVLIEIAEHLRKLRSPMETSPKESLS